MPKIRTTIYIDPNLREAIREVEYQKRQSMATIIVEAIEQYLMKTPCTKKKKTILSK